MTESWIWRVVVSRRNRLHKKLEDISYSKISDFRFTVRCNKFGMVLWHEVTLVALCPSLHDAELTRHFYHQLHFDSWLYFTCRCDTN